MESWNIKRLFGSKSNFEINFDLRPSVSLLLEEKTAVHIIFFVFCLNFLVLGIGAPRTGQSCLKLIGGGSMKTSGTHYGYGLAAYRSPYINCYSVSKN